MTDGPRAPAAGAVLGDAVLTEAGLAAWGGALGVAAARDGVFVALFGELGAGKSTLVRAACRALGVDGPVPSPTFTILNVHRTGGGGGGGSVFHADLYRLDPPVTERVLVDAGWPDVLESEGPVFVEWADRAAAWLPADRWDVRLSMVPGRPDVRRVAAEARGRVAPIPSPEPLRRVDPPSGGGPC